MKNQVKILEPQDLNQILNEKPKSPFLAMYSSYFGGVIKDTRWMMLPIDDHVVHRGDGVFEAMKFLNSRIYGLDEHLARLERSAKAIELTPSQSFSEIKNLILQTARLSGASDGLIRLYLTRGVGGFTTNPYDCAQTGLYVVITKYKAYDSLKYQTGVSCKISKFKAKEDFYAQIKSCNYLQNVLMKKDAVDSNCDFTVAVDTRGFITEGSTENCAFVNASAELLIPSFEYTLRGITLSRLIELAQSLVKSGELKAIKEKHITQDEAFACSEMAFVGTTLDVLPVATLNQKKIGSGRPGPIFHKLQAMILEDLTSPHSKMNTPL